MSTATTSTPRYNFLLLHFLLLLLPSFLPYLLAYHHLSTTPTLTPTTSTPSSSYPSLSPSTVYVISTVAGSSTSGSYSGDGSAATSALLNAPYGVRIDTTGEQLTTYCCTPLTYLLFPM